MLIKQISYSYNSALESAGQKGYFFDCLISRDGSAVIERHEAYSTREDLYAAMEGLIPFLETT